MLPFSDTWTLLAAGIKKFKRKIQKKRKKAGKKFCPDFRNWFVAGINQENKWVTGC
jgi:hypothetical protein